MRTRWGLALAALISSPAVAAPKTPMSFVTLYLHEVAEIDGYRAQAERNQSATREYFVGCVHDTEAWKNEVNQAASLIGAMNLTITGPAKDAPQLLSGLLDLKAKMIEEIRNACAAFIGDQKPGIDYSGLAVRAPKIRAQLEAIDKTLFDSGAVLAFATLIDDKPDRAGHVSFLAITREERAGLLRQIEADFGKAIASGDMRYPPQTARLFRDKLNEYHVADER